MWTHLSPKRWAYQIDKLSVTLRKALPHGHCLRKMQISGLLAPVLPATLQGVTGQPDSAGVNLAIGQKGHVAFSKLLGLDKHIGVKLLID